MTQKTLNGPEAVRRLTRWVGRGQVEGAYTNCCGSPEPDLAYAEAYLSTESASPTREELAEALQTLCESLDWEENRSGTTYNGHERARALLARMTEEK